MQPYAKSRVPVSRVDAVPFAAESGLRFCMASGQTIALRRPLRSFRSAWDIKLLDRKAAKTLEKRLLSEGPQYSFRTLLPRSQQPTGAIQTEINSSGRTSLLTNPQPWMVLVVSAPAASMQTVHPDTALRRIAVSRNRYQPPPRKDHLSSSSRALAGKAL